MASTNLEVELEKVLEYYSKEVTEEIKEAAQEVAEKMREKIRNNSPVDTGKYRRGWSVKKSFENANEIRYTVYNTRYQLTHLLEKGTKKMRAQPHIKPAEEWGIQEFERRIKEAVKK